MSYEEFLNIVKIKCQELEREYISIVGEEGLKEAENAWETPIHLDETNFKAELIYEKLRRLRMLNDYPLYVMSYMISDFEVEAWRNEKCREVLLQGGTPYEIEKNQHQFKSMSLKSVKKVIRDSMLVGTNVQMCFYYANQLISNWSNSDVNSLNNLLAAVTDDYTKADKVAKLFAEHSQLEKDIVNAKASFDYPLSNPQDYSWFNGTDYNEDTNQLTISDKSFTNINQAKVTTSQLKESFNILFDASLLKKLVITNQGINLDNPDLKFLKIISNFKQGGNCSDLEAKIRKRNLLKKQWFKSKDTKRALALLDEQIPVIYEEICNELRAWLQTRFIRELGLAQYTLRFDSEENLISDLEKIILDVNTYEQDMLVLFNSIESNKTLLDARKEEIREAQNNIAEKIRAIAGPDFINTDISGYGTLSVPIRYQLDDRHLGATIGATIDLFSFEIMEEIKAEAQNQAEIREANLRGISVQELRRVNEETEKVQKDSNMASNIPTP